MTLCKVYIGAVSFGGNTHSALRHVRLVSLVAFLFSEWVLCYFQRRTGGGVSCSRLKEGGRWRFITIAVSRKMILCDYRTSRGWDYLHMMDHM